jgi:hypothetical protein
MYSVMPSSFMHTSGVTQLHFLILCSYQQGLPPTTDVKSVISDAEMLQTGTWFALICACLCHTSGSRHLCSAACLMQAWHRLQQCLSPLPMISPVLCVAKSNNLDADVNLELSEDSRHRGLKGTPLSPKVLLLATSLLVKFASPFACCLVSQRS